MTYSTTSLTEWRHLSICVRQSLPNTLQNISYISSNILSNNIPVSEDFFRKGCQAKWGFTTVISYYLGRLKNTTNSPNQGSPYLAEYKGIMVWGGQTGPAIAKRSFSFTNTRQCYHIAYILPHKSMTVHLIPLLEWKMASWHILAHINAYTNRTDVPLLHSYCTLNRLKVCTVSKKQPRQDNQLMTVVERADSQAQKGIWRQHCSAQA
jgi:hypothetical protein